jgi:hypothetical protein
LGKEGDWQGRRHAGERGGRREQEKEGGGKKQPWTQIVRGGTGDATKGEKIWLTAKEEERVRATHGVDTNAAMVAAVTEGRRKRRHCLLSSSSEEEKNEEEEGE